MELWDKSRWLTVFLQTAQRRRFKGCLSWEKWGGGVWWGCRCHAAGPFSDTLSPASWFSHAASGVKYRPTVPVMNGDVWQTFEIVVSSMAEHLYISQWSGTSNTLLYSFMNRHYSACVSKQESRELDISWEKMQQRLHVCECKCKPNRAAYHGTTCKNVYWK